MRAIRIMAAAAMAAALLVPSAVPASAAPTAQLMRISAEHHKGYDRVLFWFGAAAPDDVDTTWSDDVPLLDPSGLPSGIEGNAFLTVTFRAATGFDAALIDGTSYGRTSRAYDLPNVVEVTTLGDYEAVLSFGIGTMHRATNVHVHVLSDPARVAIDIGTWFDRTTRTVWFADTDTFDGDGPYLVPVERVVPAHAAPLQSIAHRLFAGPTGWEMMRGLRIVKNGATGFTKLTLDADGVARIRLVGTCGLVDRPTTIGAEAIATLKGLPRVDWVKVLDPSGHTTDPAGPSDSLPACLIP